ncbi:MAG TPA: hypothetical protein VG733_04015 [Chthoniobacteraceae bacterium]|nr:hypothetical protein [Chthoniobacteraceae bacterium]
MSSPAHADAPASTHAPRTAGSGWAKVALGALILMLLVEFVLPGFVAAEFSRAGPAFQVSFVQGQLVRPPGNRAVQIMLAPARWLESRSMAVRSIYVWEYGVAGGKKIRTSVAHSP